MGSVSLDGCERDELNRFMISPLNFLLGFGPKQSSVYNPLGLTLLLNELGN